jgi:hypothetical protein
MRITHFFGGKIAQKFVESEAIKSRAIIQANKQLSNQNQ